MLRLVVWLLLLAAVLYAVFWSIDRRAGAGEGERESWRDRSPRRTPPTGPRGPDDDEDFLRELDRRRREER
ncbi:MAG: hypothetical protein ACTHJH_13950 [Marmoricola sp.]